jgi:hypothetical protein
MLADGWLSSDNFEPGVLIVLIQKVATGRRPVTSALALRGAAFRR